MGRTWTHEQVVSLAPDAASLKAAQGLSSPRKWTELGTDGQLIWGLAQGSGAEPYQSQIDLAEPAFKCSCPSRKFPCKHGLGLLLLYADQPSLCPTSSRPAWVEEWWAKRAERLAKAALKSEAAAVASGPAAADPSAQIRRREKRENNVQQGVDFLESWLRDLVRQGISSLATAGYGFWDTPARRLIDAQAPGLARRVRDFGTVVSRPTTTDVELLAQVGRLHLLLAAYRRRSQLSSEWKAELDTQAGWTADQDELRRQPGLDRAWLIAAQTVREEERLTVRTSYLFSHDGLPAKIVEFTHASQAAVASLALGRWVRAELIYFPGVAQLRAITKAPPQDTEPKEGAVFTHCHDILAAFARRLAANPLADELPVRALLIPQRESDRWWVRDTEGAVLPIAEGFVAGWELHACAGGEPIVLCGTWDGRAFLPLSLTSNRKVINLAEGYR